MMVIEIVSVVNMRVSTMSQVKKIEAGVNVEGQVKGETAAHTVVRQMFKLEWDKWTFESLVEGVLVAAKSTMSEGRKTRVIASAGRALRGAFKGYKAKTISDADVEYALALIGFEVDFDLKAKSEPVVKSEEKKSEEVKA